MPKLKISWHTPMGQTTCVAEQVMIQNSGLVVVVYDSGQDSMFVPEASEHVLGLEMNTAGGVEQLSVKSFGLSFDLPLDPGNPHGPRWKLVLLKMVE